MTSVLLHGCETRTLLDDSTKKDPGFQNWVPEETFPHLLLGAQNQWLDAEQDQLPCGSTGNLFWQMSRDRNLHGLGLSNAMTAFPKPSFIAPWKMGDAMVSRGNAGWTVSKSWHPYPCLDHPRGPPREKTGRGSLLNHSSWIPNGPAGQRRNWLLVCLRHSVCWCWFQRCYVSCFWVLIVLCVVSEDESALWC